MSEKMPGAIEATLEVVWTRCNGDTVRRIQGKVGMVRLPRKRTANSTCLFLLLFFFFFFFLFKERDVGGGP